MEHGTSRRLIVLAWVVMVGLITADELRRNRLGGKQWPQLLPCPARYIKGTVAFTLFSVAGEFIPQIAAVLAVGVDIALFTKMAAAGDFGNPSLAPQYRAPSTSGPGPRQLP